MPLLGPTFTVSILTSSPEAYELVLTAVAGKEGSRPLPELQSELLATQSAVITQHVRDFTISHDGYSVDWEGLGLDLDGANEPLILAVAINITCKDEDFDSFEELLTDKRYEAGAIGALRSVLTQWLSAREVDPKSCTFEIEADGFGYG